MILTVLATVIGLSICVSLVKLGLIYLNSYRILLRSKCFRGPKALPFIGNALLFTGNTADIYRKIQEVANTYESPMRIWIGPFLYFCIDDPEQVKLVLTNPNGMSKTPIYDIVKPLLGDGLLTSAETTTGTSGNVSSEHDSTFFDMAENALSIVALRATRPWLYPDFIFKLSSTGQRFHKCKEYINNFLNKTLTNEKHVMQKELTTQPRNSLLGLLLNSSEAGYKFTDEEVLDELVTVIGGGYETTATMMTMALFILARYPDIQDKVYAEVCETYGMKKSEGLEITIQDLERMQYLDRVLKETMRMFPVGPILSRGVSEDINIGEYTLPAGSLVIVGLPSIHRKEKYWPKPLEFNPDRFLPMHPLGPRHPNAFIPFSIGARNCIGVKYATPSMKILLATLLSKYSIKTTMSVEAKDIEFNFSMILSPTYPIRISVHRRFPEVP